MISIFKPFRGTLYNYSVVKGKDVTAPPYDVISQEYRDALYERDAHNIIRLELNRDDNPYVSAAKIFQQWKTERILVRDETPIYYVYYQTFTTPEGEQVTRRGVLGTLKITPYSAGAVLPHEQTLPKAKKDRFALLDATKSQISPIFGLIEDETRLFDHTIDSVTAKPPVVDIDETLTSGETVRHTMWKLTEPSMIARLEKLIATKKVIIADGHHRYETAVAYSEANPENVGAGYIMIFLANIFGEGTVVLPTHRILHSVADFNQFTFINELKNYYSVHFFSTRKEAVNSFNNSSSAFAMIQFPEEPQWVVVEQVNKTEAQSALNELAVYRLHNEILKPIAGLTQEQIDSKTNLLYPHTLSELDEMLLRQDYNAAFILKAITPQEMISVTGEGTFMPQKSTYFYPKLLTGLVLYEF